MSTGEHPEHSYADRWELETAVRLHTEHGHDWVNAAHLAALMRDIVVEPPVIRPGSIAVLPSV